jgi:hypothetical protein
MIPINPYLLVQGKAFTCPTCTARIAMEPTSIPIARETLDKFQNLTKSLEENKTN